MWVQGRGDQHALACVRTVVWDESTNSATSPVLAAFHISMTKPAKKQRNLRKTAGGNEQDTSFAATAVVEKLVDLELGGRHGATQPAKLSREIRVASRLNGHLMGQLITINGHLMPVAFAFTNHLMTITHK